VHTSRRSLPGCMRPSDARTEKWHVCPGRPPILRGAYITEEGVVTYAPPGGRGGVLMDITLDERRGRLSKWLDIIKENVTEAVINQHIFWEMQDIIRHNPQLQKTPSAFYQWMGAAFVHSSALAVRREVDRDPKSVSLVRFLTEVRDRPDLVSREYHRSLYDRLGDKELADDLARRTYDRHVGASATALDQNTVQQEIDSLQKTSKIIRHYANRAVAHYDTRGLSEPVPSFADLGECLRVLETLVLRYMLLLKGASQSTLLPTFMYDWKAIFRIAWIG